MLLGLKVRMACTFRPAKRPGVQSTQSFAPMNPSSVEGLQQPRDVQSWQMPEATRQTSLQRVDLSAFDFSSCDVNAFAFEPLNLASEPSSVAWI